MTKAKKLEGLKKKKEQEEVEDGNDEKWAQNNRRGRDREDIWDDGEILRKTPFEIEEI